MHAGDEGFGVGGGGAAGSETVDELADGGSFRPDGAQGDGRPDFFAKALTELVQIFAVDEGVVAEHGRDDGKYLQRRHPPALARGGHHFTVGEALAEAIEAEVFAFGGVDEGVGGEVDGTVEHGGGGGSIDDDEVEEIAQFLDAVGDHEGIGDLDGDAAGFDVGGDEVQGALRVFIREAKACGIGRAQDVLKGSIAHEEVIEAGCFFDAEGEGGVALGIGIEEDDAQTDAGQAGGDVSGEGRLADAAFFVEEGDDFHGLQYMQADAGGDSTMRLK